MASIDKALMMAENDMSAKAQGQQDLLSGMSDEPDQFDYVSVKPISFYKKLLLEKESLGYYLTGHPLDEYQDEFKLLNIQSIESLNLGSGIVYVCGLQGPTRVIKGKRGRFAFMRLEDPSGFLETAFFNDTYDQFADALTDKVPLICQGKITHDEFNNCIRMEILHLFTIQQFRLMKKGFLKVELRKDCDKKDLQSMNGIFKAHQGGSEVRLFADFDTIQGQLKVNQTVSLNQDLIEALNSLVGIKKVSVGYQIN